MLRGKKFEKEDFNRQSISIPREILNKLSKNNKFYILKRRVLWNLFKAYTI